MSKPTVVSVTEVPCSCGFLATSARDPNLPVRFDVEMNEYLLEYRLSEVRNVSMVLYHCPMCGGIGPRSHRRESFATISEDEVRRLEDLTCKIESIQDLEKLLGSPDNDRFINQALNSSGVELRSGVAAGGTIRVLTYNRLSDVADAQFTVHPDGRVEVLFAPKKIA